MVQAKYDPIQSPDKFHCKRCGHNWIPIHVSLPKSCRHCNSPRWNLDKLQKLPGCKGYHHTTEAKQRIRQSRLSEKNSMWAGDKVGKPALHRWVNKRKPKPSFCEKCGVNKPIDLANISGTYLRDINDYEWLCRKCHMDSDGRMNNLKQFQIPAKMKKVNQTYHY